ncbi:MAG: oxygen-dependent coproporphyrinogen oxidase [Planctomycetes bacterium]|nr:oxygen-dependent coproporphyrinogen oxidase [Planctomycetota bacterium]
MRKEMEELVRSAQDSICAALAKLDGGRFLEDEWERPGGGGGRSRVLEGGAVLERAGVNVSVVHGALPEDAARAMRGGAGEALPAGVSFFAAGISLVIHPRNPFVPTVHANYRYFECGEPGASGAWWFGGGADLTPCYLFEEDAAHFHRTLKRACEAHDPAYYPRFKRWCDDYFLIRHRGERRGVGGIFFDDLRDRPAPVIFSFLKECVGSFLGSYLPIVERRCGLSFTDEHRRWQALRHGRYVEFNLIYDRGTTFGLRTGARTESVLMALPRTARWEYGYDPNPESPEGRLVQVLRVPRDWA